MKRYEFEERMAIADQASIDIAVKKILKETFPEALSVRKSHLENDRLGVDYWVECWNGKHIGVDVKVRSQDYAVQGKPDICLEIWSNIDSKKPGWTRDPQKLTDYVLWYWCDTARSCLVDFRMLRAVFMQNWQAWETRYPAVTQVTQNASGSSYKSRSLFISSADLHRELYWRFGGHSKSPGAAGNRYATTN